MAKSSGVFPYKFFIFNPVVFFSKIKLSISSYPWEAHICKGKFCSLSLKFILAPLSINNFVMSK